MNKLDESAAFANYAIPEQTTSYTQSPQASHDTAQQVQQESTLRAEVDKSLKRYFQHIEDEPVTDLHRLVMSEVEAGLVVR